MGSTPTCGTNFMNQSPSKQIVLRLSRVLDLFLRQDEWIELPLEEAILIDNIDKEKQLCYVEFPSKTNTLSAPRLWRLSAWLSSQEKHKQAVLKAAQDRVEFDNYKANLYLIAEKLSSITLIPSVELVEQAKVILRSIKPNENWMDVKLIHPFYRGEYIILPFRER